MYVCDETGEQMPVSGCSSLALTQWASIQGWDFDLKRGINTTSTDVTSLLMACVIRPVIEVWLVLPQH